MKFFIQLVICLSALILSVLAAPASRATVMQVVNDLNAINGQVLALTKSTNAFDGTAAQAGPIESAAIKLIQANNGAVNDLKAVATPLSLANGTIILNVVKSAEPNIEACLSAIVKQKSALSKLLLQTAVHATLINLETSVQALINALITAAPAALKSDGMALGAKVTTSFTAAIAAFA